MCRAARPAGLAALAIPFRINPRLVRGLDYYGHIAFEITSSQLGAQATLCGSAISKQFMSAYKSVARWAAVIGDSEAADAGTTNALA
jgi:histidyl-tRNA synthetase